MIFTIIFYNSIVIISTALLYISERERTLLGRKLCLFLAFIVTMLPNAFRYRIGSDYLSYELLYSLLSTGKSFDYMEPGFLLITQAFVKLGLGPEWMFGFIAFFIHLFTFLAYPTKNKYLAHLFFMLIFYLESFNTLRQMMAVALVMYSFRKYLIERSVGRFYLTILIASTLHSVALLFLVIPFMNNKLNEGFLKNWGWSSFLGWLLIFFSGTAIFSFISSLFTLIPILDYSHYLEIDRYSSGQQGYSIAALFIRVGLYFFPFLFIRRLIQYNKNYTSIFILLIFFILFWAMSYNIFIFGRAKSAFEIAIIFIVVIIFSTPSIPYRKSYTIIFALFLFFVFNKTILNSHTDRYITCNPGRLAPYVTIFNKNDSKRSGILSEQSCRSN